MIAPVLVGQESVHSGSVSQDDGTSVPWEVKCDLISVTGSHTMPVWHSKATSTSMGQGVSMFSCNLSPALLKKWLGYFMCHAGGMVTKVRVSTERLHWKTKFPSCSCHGSNPWPSNHQSSALKLSYIPTPSCDMQPYSTLTMGETFVNVCQIHFLLQSILYCEHSCGT